MAQNIAYSTFHVTGIPPSLKKSGSLRNVNESSEKLSIASLPSRINPSIAPHEFFPLCPDGSPSPTNYFAPIAAKKLRGCHPGQNQALIGFTTSGALRLF
jgi:hypothetical protein